MPRVGRAGGQPACLPGGLGGLLASSLPPPPIPAPGGCAAPIQHSEVVTGEAEERTVRAASRDPWSCAGGGRVRSSGGSPPFPPSLLPSLTPLPSPSLPSSAQPANSRARPAHWRRRGLGALWGCRWGGWSASLSLLKEGGSTSSLPLLHQGSLPPPTIYTPPSVLEEIQLEGEGRDPWPPPPHS